MRKNEKITALYERLSRDEMCIRDSNYALFMAARDLCDKTEAVTMADLAEPEVIDPEALRLIVNATLIARYGLAAFQIRARGAEYER